MREVKFRAWDTKAKIIRSIFLLNSMGEIIPLKDEVFNNVYSPNDLLLMQYTGLKDSKGKEIYEGDIVKAHPNIKATVLYDESLGGFVLRGLEAWNCYFRRNAERYEVIGNIYENSELAKIE